MRTRSVLVLVAAIAALLSSPPAIADGPAPDGGTAAAEDIADQTPDYDPWQPFNERTFWFNYYVLDKHVLKPVAHVWDRILPDPVQHGIENVFDNASMPRRLINDLLQVRPRAAGREIARFMFNSTFGLAGLIDVAQRMHGPKGRTTPGGDGGGRNPHAAVPESVPNAEIEAAVCGRSSS